MAFDTLSEAAGKKRKRTISDGKDELESSHQKRIKALESGIVESRTNYNNIVKLQEFADDGSHPKTRGMALVALCRVFCILLAGGSMTKSQDTPRSEVLLVDWLNQQYSLFSKTLLDLVKGPDDSLQELVVTLAMKLVKEEATSLQTEQIWQSDHFAQLVQAMMHATSESNSAHSLFVSKYLNVYDDVRYYTFRVIATLAKDDSAVLPGSTDTFASNRSRLATLLAIDPPAEKKHMLFHGPSPENKKHPLYSLAKHKKQAQDAWISLLKAELSDSQRKEIISALTGRVVPWFMQVDMLADFLTDSYNAGGAISLLSLSGIYYLIEQRNLDYPSFYVKLYSLLDQGLLHSKHRSRFFRQLDIFMSSSHLPAALVASFIKRLARLSLSAPPAGIVVVCPWIYNTLRSHPQCTFMIHREAHDQRMRKVQEEQGLDDPFDMEEVDPMMTGAIESSLWEIETLQSHYHPNVASLARIISEPFTKQMYKMEDFLDYSYASIIEADLGKTLKRTPVTEWMIPKHIFTTKAGGLNDLGNLLLQVKYRA